jgi:hypothetical protein
MKISKYRLVTFSVFIAIFCYHIFVLGPYIKEKYFHSDVRNFKEVSWKFSLLISFIVLILFFVYGYRKKIISIRYTFSIVIIATLFGFFFKSITDDFLLFLNSKCNIVSQTKVYHIVSDKTNGIFHIHEDKNEFITSLEQLNKIDSLRILKKYPTIYKLQNGDTLNVQYKIGLFKVKFLE